MLGWISRKTSWRLCKIHSRDTFHKEIFFFASASYKKTLWLFIRWYRKTSFNVTSSMFCLSNQKRLIYYITIITGYNNYFKLISKPCWQGLIQLITLKTITIHSYGLSLITLWIALMIYSYFNWYLFSSGWTIWIDTNKPGNRQCFFLNRCCKPVVYDYSIFLFNVVVTQQSMAWNNIGAAKLTNAKRNCHTHIYSYVHDKWVPTLALD